jgi:hypothetical protein
MCHEHTAVRHCQQCLWDMLQVSDNSWRQTGHARCLANPCQFYVHKHHPVTFDAAVSDDERTQRNKGVVERPTLDDVTALPMTTQVFWDTTPCRPEDSQRRRLLSSCSGSKESKKECRDPDDGGNKLRRNTAVYQSKRRHTVEDAKIRDCQRRAGQ